ncbi:MAG: hypothetical protein MI924_36895 [Chloroflexales bacterium]|nr:hypothetical protein [Chloroflexales bacterium]
MDAKHENDDTNRHDDDTTRIDPEQQEDAEDTDRPFDPELHDEAQRITALIKGKVVDVCYRHRKNELVIVFERGRALFVDSHEALELSVTEGYDIDDGDDPGDA